MKTPLLTAVLFLLFTVSSKAQVFHENFEVADSVSSWTNGGPGWAPNSRIPYSGSFCDSATITGIGDTIMLTTNPFSTLGMGNVYLYFHHIAKIEALDGGTIEISTDGGLNWLQLMDNAGNPWGWNNCKYYGGGPFIWLSSKFQEVYYAGWYPGDSLAVPGSSWWRREVLDLSAYFSNLPDVRLRFVLRDNDANGSAGRAGWYIDDIYITSILDTNLVLFPNYATGKVYLDMNSNQVQDSLERGASFQRIDILPGYFNFNTLNNGRYGISHNLAGSHTVTRTTSYSLGGNYYNAVPANYTINVSAPGQIDSLLDFALQPAGVYNDLCVTMYVSSAIHWWANPTHTICYWNKGTTTINNCTVVVYPENNMSYVSSSITPAAVYPDSILWNIGDLAPFDREYFTVTTQGTQFFPIGTVISSNVKIEPISGDADPANNFDTSYTFITASWDPNEIMVNLDEILTTSFPNVPELEYVIRFQNTGNDTARVVNILNYIPAELDFSTFQMMASTHDVELEYNPINRLMKFKFDNIMLPDSSTNEPESHGIVSYRIKPDITLQSGDTIFNQAHIYFDYNAVVNTNFATTAIVDPMFIHSNYPTAVDFQLMPNPVGEVLFVELNADVQNDVILQISDISGKAVAEHRVKPDNNNHQFSIDCSKLPNGVYFVKKISASGISVGRFVKIRR